LTQDGSISNHLPGKPLAKLSGIVLSHPGPKLESEVYTDSLGSIEINQELSEKRAESVRSYLLEQRLS
jgi:outer membrane protein OmpA-like peptidoglycan-associated protein